MIRSQDRRTLRAELRARRRALTPAQRMQAAAGVAASLERLPEALVDERIGGYWAVDGEVPLLQVVAGLRRRGQRFYLPRVGPARRLRFAEWRAGVELAPNRYGIPEPICADDDLLAPGLLDVVLVPLLGFDREGHRLGAGGGYYDASFAFLRDRSGPDQPLLVGVGYAMQELDALPSETWDVHLDYVATEHELIACWPEPAAS